MVRACANASALQCIMMTALQILEPVTRPRSVAPQYIVGFLRGDRALETTARRQLCTARPAHRHGGSAIRSSLGVGRRFGSVGLTRCRGRFRPSEAAAVEIAETGVPKFYCDANLGYMRLQSCKRPGRRRAGSKTPRRPLSAAALTRTYPPLPDITGILVDPSQLIRCEFRSSVLCRPARTMERRRPDC
jgi:hypothetical protein